MAREAIDNCAACKFGIGLLKEKLKMQRKVVRVIGGKVQNTFSRLNNKYALPQTAC